MTNENINTELLNSPPSGGVRGGIIVKNLIVKLQGITVLDNISFELKHNEHLAIVGSSGSGKTTLAKALSDQLFHQGRVDIHFDEHSILKPKLSFVEQHYHFKNLSNVAEFYYQQRYNSFDAEDAATVEQELKQVEKDDNAIDGWLTRLNMQHRKHSPLVQLSSGEHKRFQLIKAFLTNPQILILDAPFVGLDVNTREQLYQIINKASANGIKIIIITNADEIPSCITHVLTLKNSRLKSFVPREIFEAKQNYSSTTYPLFNIEQLPFSETTVIFNDAVKMVNVSVQYGDKKILNYINWLVKQGERWLVKGPNGAGKSTLLSLITADNPKVYANEIYLFDKRRGSGESIWDIKQKIGYVSPELHWYFDSNVSFYEVVASGFFDTIGLFRNLSQEQQNMIKQWLDFLNLSHLQHKQLASASTGEQRLALLARAFIKNPPLLVLDEPCQGLDHQQTQNFTELVDALCTQLNKTLIYVSHYDHEVPQCIDKVLELRNAKQNIYSINKLTALAV
jgi:molybdate transport system ATP-binding protein